MLALSLDNISTKTRSSDVDSVFAEIETPEGRTIRVYYLGKNGSRGRIAIDCDREIKISRSKTTKRAVFDEREVDGNI